MTNWNEERLRATLDGLDIYKEMNSLIERMATKPGSLRFIINAEQYSQEGPYLGVTDDERDIRRPLHMDEFLHSRWLAPMARRMKEVLLACRNELAEELRSLGVTVPEPT